MVPGPQSKPDAGDRMRIGRVLAAVALALVAWCAVATVGFMLAVASVTWDAGGAVLVVLVTTVVAAVAAAVVAMRALQRGAAHRHVGRGAMLGLAIIWPVVFGLAGVIDNRAIGGPVWLAPLSGIFGVATAAAAGWKMADRRPTTPM